MRGFRITEGRILRWCALICMTNSGKSKKESAPARGKPDIDVTVVTNQTGQMIAFPFATRPARFRVAATGRVFRLGRQFRNAGYTYPTSHQRFF